jgi:hypothetical protein
MNGRLAALAEQAGYFIKFERTGNDVTVVHTKEPGTDGDLALFAELIVRECVQTLNTEIDRLCEYKNSLPEYSNHSQREDVDLVVEKCHDNIQMIKQHFGVK